MAEKRLKGQEVSIRIILAGVVEENINAIGSFNDSVDLEMKKDTFLGETGPRYDENPGGYSGNLDFQIAKATWLNMVAAVEARARRETPDLEVNVVRSDLFADGSSAVIVYKDVYFGAIPTSIPAQGEFVKVSLSFGCNTRTVQINNLV